MQSDLSIPHLTCPTHLDELIIRVSLQDKEKQLFYCYECIKHKERPDLIKLQDLLPELQKKYLEFSSKSSDKALPKEAEDFMTCKNEINAEFAEHANEYKLRSDEEINKMQKEMGKLLQTVRSSVDEKLVGYEEAFNKTFNDYSDSIKAYEELLLSCGKPLPSQEELNKRIFNTSSSQDAETNLKNVLGEIKARNELKEGVLLQNITKTKKFLESGKEAKFRIPEKNQEEYESKLKPLQIYLEALVIQSKEEPTSNEKSEEKQANITKEKELSKGLCQAFEKLNKALEDSNNRIKSVFEAKFGVTATSQSCLASKNGIQPVKNRAYRCSTCQHKYSGIRQTDFVCEGCKDVCHQGHELELVATMEFVCQCQFTMRECKLATSCTIKHTGRSYVRQAYFSCKTDNMGSNNCICSFCANNCHKGHTIELMNTGIAFCDCPEMFSFCKHNQQS